MYPIVKQTFIKGLIRSYYLGSEQLKGILYFRLVKKQVSNFIVSFNKKTAMAAEFVQVEQAKKSTICRK